MINRFAGIDIGSRTIELVVIDKNGKIVQKLQSDTGFDPTQETRKLLVGVEFDRIMATGYGRNLFELSFEASTVTETKAHACGARALFPDALAVLDIGGQDSKAIALSDNGRVTNFEIAKGQDRRQIALGLHSSVVRRVTGMVSRVSIAGTLVFTGGVAKNRCMQSLLAEKLSRKVLIPEEPQFVGALGAALLAREQQ